MEYYELSTKTMYDDILYCMQTYSPDRIFIRLAGSMGGTVKIDETLDNRVLGLNKSSDGLSILINQEPVFLITDKEHDVGFSVAYTRYSYGGHMIHLPCGIDPDDTNLPPVSTSIIRGSSNWHLIEISFPCKIPLKFHSWRDDGHYLAFWSVDRK